MNKSKRLIESLNESGPRDVRESDKVSVYNERGNVGEDIYVWKVIQNGRIIFFPSIEIGGVLTNRAEWDSATEKYIFKKRTFNWADPLSDMMPMARDRGQSEELLSRGITRISQQKQRDELRKGRKR